VVVPEAAHFLLRINDDLPGALREPLEHQPRIARNAPTPRDQLPIPAGSRCRVAQCQGVVAGRCCPTGPVEFGPAASWLFALLSTLV
jgi:hypothetical protein